jgi:hypothetical protein
MNRPEASTRVVVSGPKMTLGSIPTRWAAMDELARDAALIEQACADLGQGRGEQVVDALSMTPVRADAILAAFRGRRADPPERIILRAGNTPRRKRAK